MRIIKEKILNCKDARKWKSWQELKILSLTYLHKWVECNVNIEMQNNKNKPKEIKKNIKSIILAHYIKNKTNEEK